MEAYRWLEVKNIGISRRQTQTFSSADLAEENRLALRAGEMICTRRSAGELRILPHREAIAPFSSAGRGAKNPCSRMRKHSAPVCASLRQSAAKNNQFVFPKFKYLMMPALLGFLNSRTLRLEQLLSAFSLST
jgi:hypothetical protein